MISRKLLIGACILISCLSIHAKDTLSNLDNFFIKFSMGKESPPKINLDLNFKEKKKSYKFRSMSAQSSTSRIMKLTFYGVEGEEEFKNLVILCPFKEINPNGTKLDAKFAKLFYIKGDKKP